jgi:hydrogenase nickel incorporation protein HypA/HybF
VHEYSIVQALMDQVVTHAAAHRARSVQRLLVRLGELSGVDAGLLDTAWRTYRVRTMCEDASLEIETIPAEWTCGACGADVEKGAVLTCARCGSPARLRQGDEIVLVRIEMEAGHV